MNNHGVERSVIDSYGYGAVVYVVSRRRSDRELQLFDSAPRHLERTAMWKVGIEQFGYPQCEFRRVPLKGLSCEEDTRNRSQDTAEHSATYPPTHAYFTTGLVLFLLFAASVFCVSDEAGVT